MEMKNVEIDFDIMHDGERVQQGYNQIRCHMIFDVKMEDFRLKTRLVANGLMTKTPKCQTYSSVLSYETVRISLTISALNDIKVKGLDAINAYTKAPITEKVWTILGNEWGADSGKKFIIIRALYSLKSSGAALRKHLAECMRNVG